MTSPPTVLFTAEPTPAQTNRALHLRSQHPDGCQLQIEIPGPGDPVQCWTWTRGGERLGDQLDVTASHYGLTLADLVILAERYTTISYAGDVRVAEIRLGLALAALRAGERAASLSLRCAADRATSILWPSGRRPAVVFGPKLAQRSFLASAGAR